MKGVYIFGKGGVHLSSIERINARTVYWVDAYNPSKRDIKDIADLTKVDEQVITRIIDEAENPYVEDHEHTSLIVFKAPYFEDVTDISVASFAILVTKNGVITIHKHHVQGLESLQASFLKKEEHFQNLTHLVALILHEVSKTYTRIIDKIEEKLTLMEQKISQSRNNVIQEIFNNRRTLTYFNKSLKANRDVITILQEGKSPNMHKSTSMLYLQQDYSQLIETVETFKELLHGLGELHTTITANNMNKAMTRMTVYATFILVPTLIASIYGMNFDMPEFSWQHGAVFSYVLMLVSVFVVWLIFKKSKWL